MTHSYRKKLIEVALPLDATNKVAAREKSIRPGYNPSEGIPGATRIKEHCPMTTRVRIDPTALADLCHRYHIRRLSFFGSVLRDDFGPQSDVDMLVEFEPEHVPG